MKVLIKFIFNVCVLVLAGFGALCLWELYTREKTPEDSLVWGTDAIDYKVKDRAKE